MSLLSTDSTPGARDPGRILPVQNSAALCFPRIGPRGCNCGSRLRALPQPRRRQRRSRQEQARKPDPLRHAQAGLAGRTRPLPSPSPAWPSERQAGGLPARAQWGHGLPGLRDLAGAARGTLGAEDERPVPCRVVRPVGGRPVGYTGAPSCPSTFPGPAPPPSSRRGGSNSRRWSTRTGFAGSGVLGSWAAASTPRTGFKCYTPRYTT